MFRVVKEYERGVKLRFGKFVKMLKPGIRLVIPGIHEYKKVDLRTITQDVAEQKCITKDNVTITINAVVYYRVFDAEKAILDVKDCYYAVAQLAQTTLRNSLGGHKLDDILSNLKEISKNIKEIVDEETDPWGIKVEKIEVKDIKLPEDMERVLARVAEAEREKNAVIVRSEGEVEAAEKLAEAAKKMAKYPGAMHLRTLSTLNNLASDESNTIIFAVPIEILKSFEGSSSSQAAVAIESLKSAFLKGNDK